MKREWRPTEAEIESMCKLIYETGSPNGPNWAIMASLSPTLRMVTRRSALRVLHYYHDLAQAGDLL